MIKFSHLFLTVIFLIALIKFSSSKKYRIPVINTVLNDTSISNHESKEKLFVVKNITVRNYFQYLDSWAKSR